MRNTSAYAKILFLVVLMGVLSSRDFVALLQPALFFERIAALVETLSWGDLVALLQGVVALLQAFFSFKWIAFTLTIISLVFVALYQGRKALKALMVISENNNKRGAVFLGLAIGLHIIGSYTPYVLWLHSCSLILFIIAYIMLSLDFRIPRMLFAPLVALLFVVPPPIEDGLIGTWNAASLIAFVVISFFLAYILKALISGRPKGVKPCPLCQSKKMEEEAFCPHCGRQRSPPKPASTRFAITKFFILLLIVSVLAFVYIPTFTLIDQRATVTIYTPRGAENQSFLQTPQGWTLNTSVRLADYEEEYLEDLVILNTYASERYAENRSHILLEISSRSPYMVGSWRRLPGWWRVYEEYVALTESVVGRYAVLQKQNNTLTVLYWPMTLLFKTGSVYLTKNVGVSIFMNFTEPISESRALETLGELRSIGVPMVERWSFIDRWSLHVSTLSEICARLRDIFFTIIGVVGVFLFAGWARAKDERAERLAENALFLSEDEAVLLATILSMKKRGSIGAALFDAYKRLTKTEEDINQFYEKLNKLSKFNLLGRNYILKNGELIMIWERKFP